MPPDGTVVGKPRRILNDPARLKAAVTGAGAHSRVVLEATYGWYWAVDALQQAGAKVHLTHPLGVKMFSLRRVKNDERDARDQAQARPDAARPLLHRHGADQRARIPRTTWADHPARPVRRVQEVIAEHGGGEGTRRRKHSHYLKGSLGCARSGHRVWYVPGKSKTGETYFYFMCSGRDRQPDAHSSPNSSPCSTRR